MAARKKNAVSTTVNSGSSTAIATVDQELDNSVALLKQSINAPGGNRIRVESVGSFTTPDGFDLGSSIRVVILDLINRNFFYSQKYVEGSPVAPDCYSMGSAIASLVPEPDSPAVQNESCATCPLNAYGTADNGKGKACQNRFWVAVLLLDDNDPEAHNAPDAPIYMLDISPANRKSLEAYIGNVSRSLGHPIKTIATVTAKNNGTYALVSFTDPLPNPNYAVHAARRTEVKDMLTRRPDFAGIAAKAAAAPKRPQRPVPKPAAKAAPAKGAAPRR